MKGKISNTNRLIRLAVAAVIATLYFTNIITGTLAIVLVAMGGMMILTSALSVCPMAMMGICPGDLIKKMATKKEA